MFRVASDDDIGVYSDTVTCFIRKCVEDIVPTKTIHIYPNQKTWINSDVRAALSARTSNTFYARFEAHNTAHTESAPSAAAEEVSALSISVGDVTDPSNGWISAKQWVRMASQSVCSEYAHSN